MLKIKEKIINITRSIRLLSVPYLIGFIQGHSYLDEEQIAWLKQILETGDSRANDVIISKYEEVMAAEIGKGYGISFASGRMAFYSLMKVLNIVPGDEVILQGFTCSVMPNAVLRIGAKPVFCDIDKDTFGSSAVHIERKITSRTKLIVAQHSFGIPCDIKHISEMAKKHGIFVLEDCAITFDSAVRGTKVGNFGDAAIFSTDHTKPLNTLIGGLVYTTNKTLYEKVKSFSTDLPHLDVFHQKRLYQQFIFERKYCEPKNYKMVNILNYLKLIKNKSFFPNRSFILLTADYGSKSSHIYPYPARMSPMFAQLGIFELSRWSKERVRRKALLSEYLGFLDNTSIKKYLPKAYFDSSLDIVPLRFVFSWPDSNKMVKEMENEHIDIGGVWFREPIICCPEGVKSFGYKQGECKTSETVGRYIVNWPCVLPEEWSAQILGIFKEIVLTYS